jgi:NAD(P)-dependent dehydrogenase (short-subunit alcohol dehydrogenase family)
MRAIITGAASGIGRACAKALAEASRARKEEPKLLLVDREQAGLAAIASELKRPGSLVVTAVADLALEASAKFIAAHATSELGGLDVLVSNAGVIGKMPLAELSVSDWELSFSVNTRATWLLAKACYPLLSVAGGAIVATASISASQPTPPHGAYSASKAALVMLIRQLAYEWGPQGIRCNCISPGMIHTGMTDAVYSDPLLRAERARHIPLKRVGTPEDVARVVAFLAGPEAAYVTGVDLAVDGGVQTALMPTLRGAAVPG